MKMVDSQDPYPSGKGDVRSNRRSVRTSNLAQAGLGVDLVRRLVHHGCVKSVNVHEAKTNFSRLLAKVERGGEVIIARSGKPVARLVAIVPPAMVPTLGADAGTFVVPDDFDAPLPADLLDAFEGGVRR